MRLQSKNMFHHLLGAQLHHIFQNLQNYRVVYTAISPFQLSLHLLHYNSLCKYWLIFDEYIPSFALPQSHSYSHHPWSVLDSPTPAQIANPAAIRHGLEQ